MSPGQFAEQILTSGQPVSVLFVTYVDRNCSWWGYCSDCAKKSPCRCRWCDCCSEHWTAAENAKDYSDEYGRPWKDCPECAAWIAAGCPEESPWVS